MYKVFAGSLVICETGMRTFNMLLSSNILCHLSNEPWKNENGGTKLPSCRVILERPCLSLKTLLQISGRSKVGKCFFFPETLRPILSGFPSTRSRWSWQISYPLTDLSHIKSFLSLKTLKPPKQPGSLRVSQVSTDRWSDKENQVHIYNRILLSHNKEQN